MPKTLKASVLPSIEAFAFDIFGTVVDWRGTVIEEGRQLRKSVDWPAFANEWLKGYRTRVEKVRNGELPWANLDVLLRQAFGELVVNFDLQDIKKEKLEHFSGVWHRLRPWPDVLNGLKRLRRRYRIGTLSNGNMLLQLDMAKYQRLPWDCILSAELVRRYKPEREPYQVAADFLAERADRVIYVAAHKWDLEASKAVGLKTAFVPRPFEMGANNPPPEDPAPDPSFDVNATDFRDLARQFAV